MGSPAEEPPPTADRETRINRGHAHTHDRNGSPWRSASLPPQAKSAATVTTEANSCPYEYDGW